MLSQTPNWSPVPVAPGEPVGLTIGFEGEQPSAARALVNGEVVERSELDLETSDWAFEFVSEDPGNYQVELIVEGQFPDRLGHLAEQDALDFKDMEAQAEWEVIVVDPSEQPSRVARIWASVKDVLALYTLVMIARKVYTRTQNVRDKLGRDESAEPEDDLTTLCDFIDEESAEKDEEQSDRDTGS